jgi:hypothetical protein
MLAVGYFGAMAVDSALLAWSTEPGRDAPTTTGKFWEDKSIAPLVWMRESTLHAGVTGAF